MTQKALRTVSHAYNTVYWHWSLLNRRPDADTDHVKSLIDFNRHRLENLANLRCKLQNRATRKSA